MNYFVYVEGILGVRANLKEFLWSFGTVTPKSNKENFDKCKIKVFIEARNSKEVFNKNIDFNCLGKYHYFNAKPEEMKIYYERNFFGSSKLRYSLEIKGNEIKVIVSKNYLKYVRHRFMGLHSMSYILTDLVAGLLLQNGIATIHCSAVNMDNRSVIIFAPPNTGKTLSCIRLCEDYDYNFIAEDFALTDGNKIWSVPWTSTFRHYDDINISKFDRLANKITSHFPLLTLLSIGNKVSIEQYLGSEKIKSVSKVTDLFVLERGIKRIENNKTDGLRKIINLNKYEFNYHKAPVIIALNYFNPDFSPDVMHTIEKQILSDLISRCNYRSISETNAVKYSEIIHEIMQ